MIRFLLDMEPKSHIDNQHFVSLGWLPVSRRVEQITLCHVFKIKHGQSPDYMSQNFISQDSVHTYRTRSSEHGAFVPPKVKSIGLKSFSYNGCKLWNRFPTHIRESTSLLMFKKAVKNHFCHCNFTE